jgi:ATP-dependent DNA ligase
MDLKTQEIVDFGSKGLIEDDVLKLPILYTKDKGGKFRLWQIIVGVTLTPVEPERADTDGAWLEEIEWTPVTEDMIARGDLPAKAQGVYYTKSGQEGGAQKVTKPTYVTKGTNTGKKNFTTAFTGALRKVMTEYNKKLKDGALPNKDAVKTRGAVTTIDELIEDTDRGENPWRVFPMAFHSAEKETNWKHINFPALIQPKYDGTRLLVVSHPDLPETPFGHIDNFSRGRETYAADHIMKELGSVLEDFPGLYLDGELWKPGFGLQDISGSSRRIKTDKKSTRAEQIILEYHVFDAFYLDKPMGFAERQETLDEVFIGLTKAEYVKRVPTQEVDTREAATEIYEAFIENEGLEGAMIRNTDSPYDVGIVKEERTYKALKMKPREDTEYEIADFKEGAGKNKGLIIWICWGPELGGKTKRKQFSVSPNWPETKREDVFKLFSSDPKLFEKEFKGQQAVIQYSTLSKDNLPQQPKFLRFRNPQLEELL